MPARYDRADAAGRSLAERSLSALKWSYGGAFARMAAQTGAGIVLARLLGPEPFGLMAIAWVVLGLGILMADLGLNASIIQRPQLTDRDVRFAFTVLLGTGSALCLVILLGAPLIAAFFRRPELTPVLRGMALVGLPQALSQLPAGLLRRQLRLREVQVAQTISYVLGFFGTGVTCAWLGAGVWSLVYAAWAQALLNYGILFGCAPHPIRLGYDRAAAAVFRFGVGVSLGNLVNLVISNTDSVVVGRAFGSTQLGLYNRALQLVNGPMNALTANLQGALFPAYAHAQDRTGTLRRCYLAGVGLVSLLLLPPFLVLAAIPETVIVSIYGEAWHGAAVLFTPLALAMPLNTLLATTGPLSQALGRIGPELRGQAGTAALTVLCVALAGMVSIQAVAWTVAAMFLVRMLIMARVALLLVRGRWPEFLGALAPGLLLALTCVLLVGTMDRWATAAGLPPLGRLCVAGLLGAICQLGGIYLLRRFILAGDVGWLLGRFAGRLPAGLRRHLGLALRTADAPPVIVVASQLSRHGETGVQTHFNVYGELARKEGCEVHFACGPNDGSPVRRLRNLATRLFTRPGSEQRVLWARRTNMASIERQLRSLLLRMDGRRVIVYAQCPGSALVALRLRERGEAFRLVAVCHFNVSESWEGVLTGRIRPGGPVCQVLDADERHALPRVDALVFPTAFLRAEVLRRLPAAGKVPQAVISNPPGPEAPPPQGPSVGDILSIGTLEPRKNQGFLIEVLAAARRRGYRYRLSLAGRGPSERLFRDLALRLGVADDVNFLGYVPHASALLASHRVYAHAARMESQGIVLIEALRAGRPVLAPALGGMTETFEDGVHGCRWDLDDVEASADTLIRLLQSDATLERMGCAARQRFEACYRTDLLGARWLDFVLQGQTCVAEGEPVVAT